MLTMWVILRRLDHSQSQACPPNNPAHFSSMSQLRAATTECLHCSSLPFVMQSGEKEVASGSLGFMSFLIAWKDFIEVQIEYAPLWVVEWSKKLCARENALAGQHYSNTKLICFLLRLVSVIATQREPWKTTAETPHLRAFTKQDTIGWFWACWGQLRLSLLWRSGYCLCHRRIHALVQMKYLQYSSAFSSHVFVYACIVVHRACQSA